MSKKKPCGLDYCPQEEIIGAYASCTACAMSDYQVTNYGLCGECKYHTYEEIDRGFVCTNADSPYCTDWTDYTDTCECFEQRGVE